MVHVGARLTLAAASLPPPLAADITRELTFDNPAYREARQHRRRSAHLPRQLTLLADAPLPGHWALPRGYAGRLTELCASYGLPLVWRDERVCPQASGGALRTPLRPDQEGAVAALVRAGSGVLHAPTGSGKTLVALALATRLVTPTLVLVHTRTLLNQTIESARRHTDLEPGVFGAGRVDVRDFTVATVQSLLRRGYEALLPRFGVVILDEAHHCPAVSFRQVVQDFPARYRFGLTATPVRRDGLEPLLFATVGPIAHVIGAESLRAEGHLVAVAVTPVATPFGHRFFGNFERLQRAMAGSGPRTACIVDTVAATLGQRAVVLAERVEHCVRLGAALAARGVANVVVTGRLANAQRERELARFAAGEPPVMVATAALVGEGFDLPHLDTLYLASPTPNAQRLAQWVGRVVRPAADKPAARVIDFVDVRVRLLRGYWQRRRAAYEALGLTVVGEVAA